MNTVSKRAPERQDIEALLPWHAAGTLNRRDAERVEAALANDNELRKQYQMVREELGETIRLNESLGAPSARAMERLFAKIEIEAPRKHTTSLGLRARLTEFMAGFSARKLAFSASAAAVVIVAQAAVLATFAVKDYGAAQSDTTELASFRDVESSLAMIRFAPSATANEITTFLNTHKAAIIEGPRSGGMYRVRLAVPALPKEQLERVIREIKSETNVVSFIAVVE
jgi:anti-sigma-K factor RskA